MWGPIEVRHYAWQLAIPWKSFYRDGLIYFSPNELLISFPWIQSDGQCFENDQFHRTSQFSCDFILCRQQFVNINITPPPSFLSFPPPVEPSITIRITNVNVVCRERDKFISCILRILSCFEVNESIQASDFFF